MVALSVLASGVADAAFFNNTTGLASPSVTIDFSEHTFADNTVITSQFSDLGVTFTPNLYYQNTFIPGQPNGPPPDLTNFLPNVGGLVNPFSIFFSSPVTGAAFVLSTNPNTTMFTALLNGSVVDSGSALTNLSNPMDFYGFTGVTFDQINVSVGADGFAILDTVQTVPEPDTVQTVPEPSTWVLMLAGGGILAAGIRRLRARKTKRTGGIECSR